MLLAFHFNFSRGGGEETDNEKWVFIGIPHSRDRYEYACFCPAGRAMRARPTTVDSVIDRSSSDPGLGLYPETQQVRLYTAL